MKYKQIISIAMLFIIIYCNGQQQPPDVNLERIGENIAVIRVLGGGNLIGANLLFYKNADGSVLVDTNFAHPQLAAYIQSQVKQKFADGNINLHTIFITHWHPDHSGGIEFWRNGSTVVTHNNVKRVLASPQKGFGLGQVGQVSEFPARKETGLPDETFEDTYSLKIGNEQINAIHLNGHTGGDLIVHFPKENVIDVGDIIWPGSFPFIDNHNGGSALSLLSALVELKELSDEKTVFVPGHGETFNREYLDEYIEMVEGTIRYVSKERKRGMNLEDVKSNGLKKWESWSSALVPEEVWAEMVFKSLDE